MADSGDSWLIHDSEVGENGVADYSHFIGTWWLTIIFFWVPYVKTHPFFGGQTTYPPGEHVYLPWTEC
jgi:hypothetical protein